MTGAEIQSIILQSAQSNVREINIPGLRLVFGEGKPAKLPQANPKAIETTSPADGALSEEKHTTQSKESLEQQEAEAKEERLALMAIEDPLQFEQLIANGDLTEEEGEESDSDD